MGTFRAVSVPPSRLVRDRKEKRGKGERNKREIRKEARRPSLTCGVGGEDMGTGGVLIGR